MRYLDPVATGKNIREIMNAKHIKVVDIQEACGFGTPQSIYKWFKGINMPALDNMIIVAELLGCTVDELIVRY